MCVGGLYFAMARIHPVLYVEVLLVKDEKDFFSSFFF